MRGTWGGKLDIETRWAQRIGERQAGGRGEVRHRRSKTSARSCWDEGGSLDIETTWMQEVAKGHRGGRLDIGTRWMQEVAEGHRGGSLDIETRWTQEVVRRLGEKYRYWNSMMQEVLEFDERHMGGKLDIETRWAQGVVERQGGKLRHANHMKMHAKSCERAKGEILRPREWTQEVAERHKGRKFRYWNQMNT